MTRTINGIKVLMVDDDLLSLEAFRQILEEQNVVVRSASSVSEAMSIVRTWVPDVVLSDIGIPSEDGLSLIQKLRNDASTQNIPAIAITGYSSPKDKSRMLDAGFNLVIAKPFDPDQLIRVLADLEV